MTAATIEIACTFDTRDLLTLLHLDTDGAPAASARVAAHLPLVSDTYHTKWNGHEIFVILPPLADLPPENVTSEPQPGDVILYHREATYRAAPWAARAAGLGAYTELGLYYGTLTRSFGPSGEVAGTRLGRIVDGLEPLREAAITMRKEGFTPMRLERRA